MKEGLPVEVAAMLSVNPCTAYRMLKDFEYLHPGILKYNVIHGRYLSFYNESIVLKDVFIFDCKST